MSEMEYRLYKMVNDYRKRYGLSAIPLSKSLSYVASVHVKDLYFNHPDIEPCNSHSWSDKGTWKPFCYPRDENKKNSVWDKPKELTPYKSKGYEIVYWENSAVVIDSIISFWKSIPYFNSFLLSNGKWKGKKWESIGIGIYENYACAWFGEIPDPEGHPAICGQIERKKHPLERTDTETDKGSLSENSLPEEEQKSIKHSDKKEVSQGTPGRYYVIVKSQLPLVEMQKLADEYKLKGYPDVKILQRDGKIRLSIMDYSGKASADSALRQARQVFPDAWLLNLHP
ncbi:MAG: CAP domain-containing protein [Bacteroidota bacterium]|nr:CAP domain-containing protein [Bacteroidota bacterium]